MPITVKYDVPKSLDVLLALQSGGAVGAAERGKEDRAAARKAAEMRQEMLFKAAQEEFHARQQAYRQQLQGQQEMQQQAVQGQQRMAQLQQQQQWQTQEGQRQTEQLQQQRKANRDAFLSGQTGLGEYRQRDAAFAAQLSGLDPNAEDKQREASLQEFQKRADPEDVRELRGIQAKKLQLRRMFSDGFHKPEDLRAELARLDEKQDFLVAGVQHKPDKTGPSAPERAAKGTFTTAEMLEKKGLPPDHPSSQLYPPEMLWNSEVRNGVEQFNPIETNAMKAQAAAQAKGPVEQQKAEAKAAEEAEKAQKQAADDYAENLGKYNKQVLDTANDLKKEHLAQLKDARKAWDEAHTSEDGTVTKPFPYALRTFNLYRAEAIEMLRESGFVPPRPPQQQQRPVQPQGVPILNPQNPDEAVGLAPPEQQVMPAEGIPEQAAPQLTPQQIQQDMGAIEDRMQQQVPGRSFSERLKTPDVVVKEDADIRAEDLSGAPVGAVIQYGPNKYTIAPNGEPLPVISDKSSPLFKTLDKGDRFVTPDGVIRVK
ncbi:MAG: hypothetical protein V1755_06690 [Chloroflexota bacterium]